MWRTERQMQRDPEMDAIFSLLGQLVALTVRDARQAADPALQAEALEFLWCCTPEVAESERLPRIEIVTV